MSSTCSKKMEVKLVITITAIVLGVTAAKRGSYEEQKLIKDAYSCIKNVIPYTDWMSGNDYFYDYMVNISSQWDPLNHQDYLHWWKYDGSEAWRAGCHFSDAIRRCLQPVMERKIDLNNYLMDEPSNTVIQSLYYLALCDHERVLADNAVCIHNRMLSDDVLSCSGVVGWQRGNNLMYLNKQFATGPDTKYIIEHSQAKVNIALYQCIYTRGQWERACGISVDDTLSKLVKQFTNIVEVYLFSRLPIGPQNKNLALCNRCKKGSNLKLFKHFNDMVFYLLYSLLYENQSPDLFKECRLVDYPLNYCHTRNIWRRGVFRMFCHNVTFTVAPHLKPHLPLCDLGEWIQSAERICNMGYDRMMEMAGHIEHCTDGKDELFPCYKGLYIDMKMSWGLLTASRLWGNANITNLGATYSAVYPRMKQCSKLVYNHLSVTCRHGPAVVRLIQDIRTILSISQSDIDSRGLLWLTEYEIMIEDKQYVSEC